MTEYSPECAELRGLKGTWDVTIEMCPCCESEWIEESQLCHDLDLSAQEWERGGQQIMQAIALARGECPTKLDNQNWPTVIRTDVDDLPPLPCTSVNHNDHTMEGL